MKKTILLLLMGNRTETAVEVQKILTEMGCFIKTRLGIHDGTPDSCTNTGLLILELLGGEDKNDELVEKLAAVDQVKVKLVEMSL